MTLPTNISLSKEEAIEQHDPNGAGLRGNIFGFPFTPENADLILIPIPWEVTVSFNTGTAHAPAKILEASVQVDAYVPAIKDAWKLGISMLPIPEAIKNENDRLRQLACHQIGRVERGEVISEDDPLAQKINEACENLNVYVKSVTNKYLKANKLVGLLGGDHSTPLGFLRALGEHHKQFGILQLDAHADLRKAYEGFTYSHGSIMYNALKIRAVKKIVQVGVRDCCEEEVHRAQHAKGRVKIFFDEQLKEKQFQGITWNTLCDEIVDTLPPLVYISFDIDGLSPTLCPGTGTPVPGGLQFEEAVFLIRKVVESGRTIIGFDLCEVGGTPWDANVGARILYSLCNWMGVTNNK